jgi:arylsulfatase A-like enzyme
MSKLNRRDFLKLAALALPAAVLAQPVGRLLSGGPDSSAPNIIVLVFDSMTARNLSLYGYPRKTSPNFEKFAERATVYHNYNSAGNFTVPGTASLLTGMYPWSHRAINHAGIVSRELADRNIFNLLGDDYHRMGFAQTGWASFLLDQFRHDIDSLLSPDSFSLLSHFYGDKFPDRLMASRALDDFIFKMERSPSSTMLGIKMGKAPSSLVFGSLDRSILYGQVSQIPAKDYPGGLPWSGAYSVYFKLDEVLAGLYQYLAEQKSPFFSYVHLFPPHSPYSPTREFYGKFATDKWMPPRKLQSKLASGYDERRVYLARATYDEYVATVDFEFGKFIQSLDSAGILDNTYLFITSDHGEMFERGEKGHVTPLLYDPVIHSPLLVSVPGQRTHKDIYSPVNSVDIVPTLLHLAGKPIPSWCEGQVLPGLGGEEDRERSTFTLEAKLNPAFSPLTVLTVAMRKDSHKLIYFKGYGLPDWFELYDQQNDPEELNDLFQSEKTLAAQLKDEILERLDEAGKQFQAK